MGRERELQDTLVTLKEAKRQAVVEERFDEALRLKEEETRLSAHLESSSQKKTSPRFLP